VNLEQQRAAQSRADRIAAFRSELGELEREQALSLTPDQRAHLDAHLQRVLADLSHQFGADISEPGKRISWGMRLVSLLGGVAFFFALFLFLQRIWGSLPSSVQVSVLMVVPLGLLAATFLCGSRRVAPYYVALLGVATAVAVVLGLSALGRILNAVPSPQALLVWGAFAVLVAYAFGLRLLLGAGLVLLCVWTAAILLTWKGFFWMSLFDRIEYLLPGAAVLYSVPAVTRARNPHDFDFVFRLCGAGVGLIALLVLSKSADLCCPVPSTRMVQTLYQLAGLGLCSGIVWHGVRLGRNGLVNMGATGFVAFLFACLHGWWWDWMPRYLFFLLLGLVALCLLTLFRRLRQRSTEGREA